MIESDGALSVEQAKAIVAAAEAKAVELETRMNIAVVDRGNSQF